MALVFKEGQQALAFHGPLLYQATIQAAEIRKYQDKEQPMYFVHYKGWNKSWDEWVPESRVLEINKDNLAQQKLLEKQAKSGKRGRKPKLGEKRSTKEDSSDLKQGKRRRGDKGEETVEQEEEHFNRPEVKILIPDEFKHRLVQDWDLITKQKKLVVLPRNHTVREILDAFAAQAAAKIKKGQHNEGITGEVTAGLKVYFEHALPTLLLYKFERPQFNEYTSEHSEAEMVDVYGAEHLLRLFVKLPQLFAHTTINERAMGHITHTLSEFFKFLSKNAKTYFSGDYQAASDAYVKSAT
eukprot:m.67296 g.67296  ORF g.67296 m.67296 type:complete len:297 (-) comp19795_c0_seq3:41-931(-)